MIIEASFPKVFWTSCVVHILNLALKNIRKYINSDYLSFYNVIHSILISRWTKSYTPLHCMARSLNPRYYSDEWIQEAPNRHAPHEDEEISMERNKCLKKLFRDDEDRMQVSLEYANFSSKSSSFDSFDSIENMWRLDPKSSSFDSPCATLFLLSTYSFIHLAKRNKFKPKWAEDLVYNIGRDVSEDSDCDGTLQVTTLSLDKLGVEVVIFIDLVKEEMKLILFLLLGLDNKQFYEFFYYIL
ncbi:hypothetical protein Lal_00042601 [Lupinus albus]|nr:hypothetical protein Lal_00042601 [Lupinus albus]